MIRKNLKEHIKTSVDDLLRLGEIHCWNTISSNFSFILSDYSEFETGNELTLRASRNRVNRLKIGGTLETVVERLNEEYDDLYDINLYIFKALKRETIIEIQYCRKSDLESGYFALVKDHPPMLHSKITIPVYALEGEKFDVNWESGGGWHHAWKNFVFRSFLYKSKIKGKNFKRSF